MSQKETIITHLKRHRSITTLGAITAYGIMRLSERVRELKADGHKIKTDRIEVNNRHGGKSRVARYRLA